ncbi:TetR/AcrR family transcriptional regulator [Methanobrevibacter millerae]|uniref:Transcriptional regulator, TetR family n=1 Tax=Methanobrevibacter millerae TaxID=230361 RepID=A0A1G5XHA7_9EURY|nr:TetR/AcrR family transcriptional regulator [Methanobrevibacter millerae]SDA69813.1 transcriptional regulator, TetR family [Methanobrevibacter millerae]
MNTKKLILEKTLKLMIEKQNSLISVREISAATGIATGGIYHYFSNKEEIYNEIIERYYLNFYKFNIDELRQIKGNAKEKIHDVMAEIFKQKETGIKIESIEDEIDYRNILAILTAKGFVHENFQELCQSILNELKEFFTEIIEEGQKNGEIRQDFSTEDIVESLIIMYMGIAYEWETYLIDDMVSTFEDNFNLQWEKIRFRE